MAAGAFEGSNAVNNWVNLAACIVIATIGAALHDMLPSPWNFGVAFAAGMVFGLVRDAYHSSPK